MNAFTFLISILLAGVGASEDPKQSPEEPSRKIETNSSPSVEKPTAEPLTLVGRGTELAIIENGELEQLEAAPPILILPEPSSRGNQPADTQQRSTTAHADKPATTRAAFSSIEEALDARRERLGRKNVDTPPPARGTGNGARRQR